MRAIVVMFDSLNRALLPPYGAVEVHAPNFRRLADATAAFDRCYAGSMPCMPARREMHTGRYNFLHRSWGPLEPFDDSVPQLLTEAGVYTHLVTDHQHYWEDGGATYHNRFATYEFFRGQEGDRWKGHVADPVAPDSLNESTPLARQDRINRQYLRDEADHPQTRTVDAGIAFIETNAGEDSWFLQIECFDPHEPFFAPERYRELVGVAPGRHFDWPSYRKVVESDADVARAREEYLSLLAMCDRSLGRVLDAMDEHAMWDDTMLIVCTDHGFLLGEHGWWGKSVVPWYEENIHTPLFIWDPRAGVRGERRASLVQTIDFGPTLLGYFGLPTTPDMQGVPLDATIERDEPVREGALFGQFGAHVNVTDGRYVYLRCCVRPDNQPLHDYTLMPTHMRSRFAASELHGAELSPGFSFTKGAPVLRVPGWTMGDPFAFGSLLFDLQTDPGQREPLRDDDLELRMAGLLVDLMRRSDAPAEQFERLGLPVAGPVSREHLLVAAQWDRMQAARRPSPRPADFPVDALIATRRLRDVLADSAAHEAVVAAMPYLGTAFAAQVAGERTVLEAAILSPSCSRDDLEELERVLAGAGA